MIHSPIHPRGRIVVDTCALMDLGVEADERLQDGADRNRITYYYQTLIALAAQGFEIVIPEAVAYEAARTLKGGHCLGDYFDSDSHCSPDMARFMREVAHGQHKNISIRETEGPEDVVKFLKKLHRIVESHDTFEEKQYRIRSLERGKKKRAQYGDLAIKNYLADLDKSPYRGQQDAYLLSSDGPLLKNMTSMNNPHLCLLNMRGYIEALAESGLCAGLGFNSAPNLAQDIYEKDISVKRPSRNKSDVADKTAIDRSCAENINEPQRPFARALHGLMQDRKFNDERLPAKYLPKRGLMPHKRLPAARTPKLRDGYVASILNADSCGMERE